MAIKVLFDYIQEQKAAGYADDVIRAALLQQGYSEQDVNDAFISVSGVDTKVYSGVGYGKEGYLGVSSGVDGASAAGRELSKGVDAKGGRHLSIALISVLYYILGFLFWFNGLYFLINSNIEPIRNIAIIGKYLASGLVFFLWICLFLGCLLVITGWGLWSLKNWARIIAVVLTSLSLILIVTLPAGIVILYYLMNKDARYAFGA